MRRFSASILIAASAVGCSFRDTTSYFDGQRESAAGAAAIGGAAGQSNVGGSAGAASGGKGGAVASGGKGGAITSGAGAGGSIKGGAGAGGAMPGGSGGSVAGAAGTSAGGAVSMKAGAGGSAIGDGGAGAGGMVGCADHDTMACAAEADGTPITFPTGTPLGPCKVGKATCGGDGTFGACLGAVAPAQEVCNGIDDDCDGLVDDDAFDAVSWVYDQDNDGYAVAGGTVVKACPSEPPSAPPDGCIASCGASVNCCQPSGWVLAAGTPQTDCNDFDPQVHPGAADQCDVNKDFDCDGKIGTGCSCVDGQPCGDAATCNAGVFTDCSTTPTCTGGLPKAAGVACNVDDKGVGACLNGGTTTCGSGSVLLCTATVPSIGVDTYQTSAAPNGSYDWNCDGTTSIYYGGPDSQQMPNDLDRQAYVMFCMSGSNNPTVACAAFSDKNTCNEIHYAYCGSGMVPPVVDSCGQHLSTYNCLWSAGKCNAALTSAPMGSTQSCE